MNYFLLAILLLLRTRRISTPKNSSITWIANEVDKEKEKLS